MGVHDGLFDQLIQIRLAQLSHSRKRSGLPGSTTSTIPERDQPHSDMTVPPVTTLATVPRLSLRRQPPEYPAVSIDEHLDPLSWAQSHERRVGHRGELPGPVANQEPEVRGAVTEVHQEIADLLHRPRPARVGGHPEDVHVAAATSITNKQYKRRSVTAQST